MAQALDLPLNVGTEMNSYGQKLVDDFDAPELAPLRETFLEGAFFVYGHTRMQRTLEIGVSERVGENVSAHAQRSQRFFSYPGGTRHPARAGTACLKLLAARVAPAEILSELKSMS